MESSDYSDDELGIDESFKYVQSYVGPSYQDLPMEIILNVFAYLHPSDLHESSLTCRRWFEAARYLMKHTTLLYFSNCQLSEYTGPFSNFLSPMRHYSTVILDHVNFILPIPSFWQRLGETVQHLAIRNCDFDKNVESWLIVVQNLRHLIIENCRELMFEMDQPAMCAALKDVERLALINNRYLSDEWFQRLVSLMPKLHAIKVSGCDIFFCERRFVPDCHKKLTFHCISHFIEGVAAQLKAINFSGTLIDGAALQVLAAMNKLHLEVLELRACNRLTNSAIISLVQVQTGLQHLDLSASLTLTDGGLIEICRCLPELRVLKLRRCRALTDYGVIEIKKLQNLRVLDLSRCEAITSAGIVDGIASERNARLIELSLRDLNICALAIIRVAESFPELRKLDLRCCTNGVTNLSLQWICRYLVWLRELNLEYCKKVSDCGLTGIDMATAIRNFETNKTAIDPALPADQPDNRFSTKAKRKQIMLDRFQRCKLVPIDECSGFSIDSLRGLQSLRLSGCNRVTDVSLKLVFHLPELRELSLSECQQISSLGIASLIRQCPSLAYVDLVKCHNIKFKTIEMLAVHLKRLTLLEVEDIYTFSQLKLTFGSLYHIKCDRLRFLLAGPKHDYLHQARFV